MLFLFLLNGSATIQWDSVLMFWLHILQPSFNDYNSVWFLGILNKWGFHQPPASSKSLVLTVIEKIGRTCQSRGHFFPSKHKSCWSQSSEFTPNLECSVTCQKRETFFFRAHHFPPARTGHSSVSAAKKTDAQSLLLSCDLAHFLTAGMQHQHATDWSFPSLLPCHCGPKDRSSLLLALGTGN